MEYVYEEVISKNNLSNLNRLLINKDLDINDKEKAFQIATFLIGDKDDRYLESFINFCFSDKIKLSKELFSMFLLKINNLFDNLNEEDELLLRKKIYTISVIGSNYNKLSNEEYFSLLTRILFSNIDDIKLYFLRELFKNNIMKENIIKRNILCELVLSNKVKELEIDNYSYPSIFDIMTNEDILKLDDDNYRKVFINSIKGNVKLNYVFIEIFKNKDLTLVKKISIISYLDKVKDYLSKYSYDILRLVLKSDEVNLFNIVYCDKLLCLNDIEYDMALTNLSNSNKPLSYMKVLANANIDEERRNFALELINRGEVKEDRYLRNNLMTDYKEDVALAAISPVLIKAPIELYKEVLLMLNSWSEMLGEIYLTNKIDDRIDFGAVSSCVISLLNCSNLYDDNYQRLLFTIAELASVKSNKKLVNEIFKFASNPLSKCYIEIEYEQIIRLIEIFYNKGMPYIINNLFTNSNVLYMNIPDRRILFDTAISMDRDKILELIDNLNKKGNYTMNINSIFNGVDENTYRVIMPKVKRLSKDKL